MADLEFALTKNECASAMEFMRKAEAKFTAAVASLQNECKELRAAMSADRMSAEADLQHRRTMLDEEAAAIKQEKAFCDEAVRCSASRIRLNVGGQLFETSKPTMLAEPGSMFHALLNSGSFSPDSQTGDFFIDRDPKFFGSILNYLRDNRRDGRLNLDVKSLSSPDRTHLHRDIEYYQLQSLMHLFQTETSSELIFVGFAEWEQNCEPHWQQDEMMKRAAEAAFPGSRPATLEEYRKNLIKNLPYDSGPQNQSITFIGADSDLTVNAADAKMGVITNRPLDGTNPTSTMYIGKRLIICVRCSVNKKRKRSD